MVSSAVVPNRGTSFTADLPQFPPYQDYEQLGSDKVRTCFPPLGRLVDDGWSFDFHTLGSQRLTTGRLRFGTGCFGVIVVDEAHTARGVIVGPGAGDGVSVSGSVQEVVEHMVRAYPRWGGHSHGRGGEAWDAGPPTQVMRAVGRGLEVGS